MQAGLEGIKENLKPPAQVEANIFRMTDEERKVQGIDSLPNNLYEAVNFMKESAVAKKALGEHIFNKYIEVKAAEWDDYRIHVHDWEINNYLNRY